MSRVRGNRQVFHISWVNHQLKVGVSVASSKTQMLYNSTYA